MHNKVKIKIAGSAYTISTTKEPSYVKNLANEINEKLTLYMHKNNVLSINNIFLLLLLEYMDNYNEVKNSENNLRQQLDKYIEEFTAARREISLLKEKLKDKN